MAKEKRVVDVLVISDIHLGTFGCRAKELLHYLKSIDPTTVVLNGDIIDIWQFKKRYWPKSHMKVIQLFLKWIVQGKQVHYITGNHDELLRKFKGTTMNNFHIENKLLLELENGKKAWIFHGDVFDVTMRHAKWLAKLGGIGYDMLISLNTLINFISEKMGYGRISLSKKIKNSVKQAVKYINDFEQTAIDIALKNSFDYVVCGHIHQPAKRKEWSGEKCVTYLNSGDWIENLTALEYTDGNWNIYTYKEEHIVSIPDAINSRESEFEALLNEISMVAAAEG
ncbi:MAG TPA: UDP-2,3-diacylglucosamine hydrolase [Flavobacteriales bacterium]|jgi:UDP-2,3-diacylglucosamine pyrophosphatase LpxH|nr:UDP-2,3-diacylglucosamine hydrolase [Flavobacteriales bacterium]